MTDGDQIMNLIVRGYDISYGKLQICHLKNYTKNSRYQVTCEYYGLECSHAYSSIETAIDKFLLLKRQIDG